jgi:chloramphenicol O-acetyltransferase type A
MVWADHRALQPIEAFRTRLLDGEVVLHDALRVGSAVPGPGRTFTFATVDWHPDAPTFLAAAAERFGAAAARVDLAAGGVPAFAYYTALPKVPFTSFTHARLPTNDAGQPETAFGKFQERDGRTMVPVGVLVNHVYVDGADLGALFEAAEASFAAAF